MTDFQLEQTDSGARLKLPSTLDLAAAEGFLAAAREAAGKPCEIDGAEVTRFSTPCAQVLVALMRSGEEVFLVAPSDDLKTGLEELGLMEEVSPRIKAS